MRTSDLNLGSRDKISWVTATAFGIFHVLAVVALFYTTWQAVVVALALHWVCIGWGIGMGYPRLHTHRSYTVAKPIEYFLAVCATLTLQGGPIFWSAIHRIHHQRSDKPGDPHTPHDGKWWSHFLWTIFGEEMNANTEVMGKYAPDLMQDRFYRVLNSWHWVPLVVLGLVLLAIGGSIQHCNIKLRYGWLNYVFNTNELHRWHHSKRIDEANHNYGAVLIVWDVVFGTRYYRPDGSPQELGIHHEERYPMNNYWKQLLIPFRWKSKMMD